MIFVKYDIRNLGPPPQSSPPSTVGAKDSLYTLIRRVCQRM